MTIDDLPQTLFLLQRKALPGKKPPKLSLVLGETTQGELVLFLWSTLPAAISWQMEVNMNAQIIETDRDQLIPMIQQKLPGCLLFYNAKPGETEFNLYSDRMIQLPL